MKSKHKEIHIFVDGSFHPTEGAGYGFVAINHKQDIVYTEAEPIYDACYQSNTCAELIASLRATKWAERNGYNRINIHYDFVGVRNAVFETPYSTNLLHCTYHSFFAHRLNSKN